MYAHCLDDFCTLNRIMQNTNTVTEQRFFSWLGGWVSGLFFFFQRHMLFKFYLIKVSYACHTYCFKAEPGFMYTVQILQFLALLLVYPYSVCHVAKDIINTFLYFKTLVMHS